MTDLGHLLASVEDDVERAHAAARPTPDALESTRRSVHRRRVRRHTRDGGIGALVVVLAVGVTAWGLQGREALPADPRPTPTAPTPSAAPTTPVTVVPLGAPVQVATPRDVPVADLLAAAGPGWSLATLVEARLAPAGEPEPDVPETRRVLALVSPTGERTRLLDVPDTASLGVVDWRPGATTALASARLGPDEPLADGTLDLTTGTLVPIPFPWERHPLGLTATGESAWFVRDMPAELAALPPEELARYSPVAPGSAVALDPEVEARFDGIDPADVPRQTGTLRLVAPDGATRDLGEVTLPHRLHPLSPDRRWLALHAADGALVGLDLRTGATHAVAQAPTDPACRLAGWADDHAVLTACPDAGAWRLDAVDVATDTGATRLATSDVTVRDAWPAGEGRVALGRVVQPEPCDVTSDPAVLEDGTVRSLTDGWSPYDHGTSLVVTEDAAWTTLNGCYVGTGRAGPVREVRVDLRTGATTSLASIDPRRGGGDVVDEDGWRVTGVFLTPGR